MLSESKTQSKEQGQGEGGERAGEGEDLNLTKIAIDAKNDEIFIIITLKIQKSKKLLNIANRTQNA